MESIEWFFNLVSPSHFHKRGKVAKLTTQHDKDKDGYLTKDEVIQLSESLLVSFVPVVILLADYSSRSSLFSGMNLEISISRQYPSSS